MEYPDHLKVPVREPVSGSADLGDRLADELLWDAANWDPDAEPPVPAMPGREPAETAERLRNGRVELVYRALGRLARLGTLPGMRWPRVWPTAAPPGPNPPGLNPPGASRPGDPWPPSGPAAGPATDRAVGVQEALKTPGVRLICITGRAGVGKTRLATGHRDRKPGEIGRGRRSRRPCRAVAGRSAPFGGVRSRAAPAGHDGL